MATFRSRRYQIAMAGILALTIGATTQAISQHEHEGTGGRCIPVSERAGRELGCFIMATEALGPLGKVPFYWHIDIYANRAEAEKAKGPRGTVVESLGKVWLFTIAENGWRASGGEHVADIGPLPIDPDAAYTAEYMEAVFKPGMKSTVHRHPGPEVWYTLTGETCLETPDGITVDRATGQHVIIPGGLPMELTAIGTELRRGEVLILHDSSKPLSSLAPDWKPKGCARSSLSTSVRSCHLKDDTPKA
jgi:quercetin dioxygenase-like cupin family protein